ncbi:hypothetical protein K8R33_05220 [archaeon]|nr:hypothetical protein [archaeon]
MDLTDQMKKRYEELKKEKEKIDKEFKAVEAYLVAVGEVQKKKRGRKKKD